MVKIDGQKWSELEVKNVRKYLQGGQNFLRKNSLSG